MGPSRPADVSRQENELLSPRMTQGDPTCLRKSPIWVESGGGQEKHICKAVEDIEGFVFYGRQFRGVVSKWNSHERKYRLRDGRKHLL